MDSNMRMETSKSIKDYCTKYDMDVYNSGDLFLPCLIQSTGDRVFAMNDVPLLSKYRSELNAIVIEHEFTMEEHRMYDCNPKRLSFDLYGTTELWNVLLDLNEVYTTSEFMLDIVKVYSNQIYDIVIAIKDREKTIINWHNYNLTVS